MIPNLIRSNEGSTPFDIKKVIYEGFFYSGNDARKLDRINHLAVLSLLFARVIYTINWFNIASIFPHIALDFKQDISFLGLLSTSFLVGIGLFQVPGGILATILGLFVIIVKI